MKEKKIRQVLWFVGIISVLSLFSTKAWAACPATPSDCVPLTDLYANFPDPENTGANPFNFYNNFGGSPTTYRSWSYTFTTLSGSFDIDNPWTLNGMVLETGSFTNVPGYFTPLNQRFPYEVYIYISAYEGSYENWFYDGPTGGWAQNSLAYFDFTDQFPSGVLINPGDTYYVTMSGPAISEGDQIADQQFGAMGFDAQNNGDGGGGGGVPELPAGTMGIIGFLFLGVLLFIRKVLQRA